ncbi:galectin-12 isoform X3 [Spea bombifrons]|uniref:galectin-12 isoform X3 n=1 Tax=Spea bombifrons TaxID=233779 RepID=UPI00234B594F|nr:galectin-12 isoform X3 [Spea bombifrons]
MSSSSDMDPLAFVLQPPACYPIVPYVCTIFGGLRPGKIILIQGSISSTASRFQIDFQSGCSTFPRADVAFHFNPRFSSSETHIICNTLQRDQWLDEVRFSKAPLHKGESFLLLFLFLADKVKPYHDELTEYPECKPLKLGKATMTTPFSMNIPGGLSEGHLIQVRGLATDEPHMINILLKCRDLVPFKLTANFQDQTLCYNHLTGPSWGEPQTIKTPFFLFHAERFFQILILSEKGVFKVAINGTHLGEFGPPDLDLKSINEVEINGSTMLYTVHC